MLTSRVPTPQSHPVTLESTDLYSILLVAQIMARRQGGEVTIPVSELMAEVAKPSAQWDRVGDNIVIRIGELCHKR